MAQTEAVIEQAFRRLEDSQRADIIYHGALLRLSELRKRLYLAESKTRDFESKYEITLDRLEIQGVPVDASYEMHEDYILWQHWVAAVIRAKHELKLLEPIVYL